MRKAARRIGLALAIIAVVFVVAVVVTARRGDAALYPPAAGAPSVRILLVHNGYHSGVVLPRAAVAKLAGERGHGALIAVTTRFADYAWLEIGWGEEEFYRRVPTPRDITFGLALRALFRPDNPSVLHVVGVSDPRAQFAGAPMAELDLSTAGFARLVAKVEATFMRGADGLPHDIGPGLYGPSLFYPAVGHFHIGYVCTNWVADMLDAAGVPTAPVLATLPQGLFFDLSMRAGATMLPRSP
ncbi:MAG TPA: DUF2459 domain-containing protein [Xanthobacteraceae bacterium]|jgi:uncharacterized protein (TIGR02117 family)